jgi:hypothetical protein
MAASAKFSIATRAYAPANPSRRALAPRLNASAAELFAD